jgi:hypothetical protein
MQISSRVRFLSVAALLLVFGCKSTTEPNTSTTNPVAGTITALIDGKPFTMKLVETDSSVSGAYALMLGDSLSTLALIGEKTDSTGLMILVNYAGKKTYSLGAPRFLPDTSVDNVPCGSWVANGKEYWTTDADKGSVTIESYDTTNSRLSASFQFTGHAEDGSVVHVTEGHAEKIYLGY